MAPITRFLFAVAMLVAASPLDGSAHSQTPAAEQKAPLRFEVASVKPNRSGDPFPLLNSSRGRYQVNNVPLRTLIQAAYQVQPFQVVNAPDWTQNERFDINAKMPGEVPVAPGVQTRMLRAMLEERFKLATHRETREMPIFALVLARADGKLPTGLEPASSECASVQQPSLQPGPRPRCNANFGAGLLTSGGITMAAFARMLSGPLQVGRHVQDRTGLAGYFQFDLKYTTEQTQNADPNTPSLVTALQEQLGLKLESARGPVEVLVIDSVVRPTPD
jgi:uncharacterized protein (TIGR03435 family)